jgi:hypothetical protein
MPKIQVSSTNAARVNMQQTSDNETAISKALTLAHYQSEVAKIPLTAAQQAANSRRSMRESAKGAGVSWPALLGTIEEPAGIRESVMMGNAVFDVVYRPDEDAPYVWALHFGNAWVDAEEFGEAFCKRLDAALEASLKIDAWANNDC